MSDPVTNVEIEDVLSSIRRLVSADDRDGAQHRQTTEAAPRQQEARLVLTPAQRVDEPEERDLAAEMDIEAPEARAADESRFDGIEDAEIVEARLHGHDTDAEILRDLPQFIRRGHREEEDVLPADRTEGVPPAEQGSAPYPVDMLSEDWDTEDDGIALSETGEEDAVGASAEVDTILLEDPVDDSPDEIDLKELEARIAGFETAVAEKEDEWEPDGSSDGDYAAAPQSPLPWQDVEDEETAGELASEPSDPEPEPAYEDMLADDSFDPAPAAAVTSDNLKQERQSDRSAADDNAWYSDDAVIDEEALRDMVSEIVRQELQGALGERITRNVRKLVRREIHRALMTQGID